MLLVHAHPDDESISTGATMAKYVAEGAAVTLLTCTRGEEGEVLVPHLEHLSAKQQDGLAAHRESELAAAMKALGVSDHRYLAEPGTWRDSGMMGEPSNARPESFWQVDPLDAGTRVAAVVREVRPHVVVTYDEFGQYGHPDHIQAHRAATYGVALAASATFRPDLGPAWDVPKVYWTALPRSFIQRGIDALVAAGGKGFFGLESVDDVPFAVEDDVITARIDGRACAARKMTALRAHATQIEASGDFFRVAEVAGPEVMGWEFFRLAKGRQGPVDAEGLEPDLFAGLPGPDVSA